MIWRVKGFIKTISIGSNCALVLCSPFLSNIQILCTLSSNFQNQKLKDIEPGYQCHWFNCKQLCIANAAIMKGEDCTAGADVGDVQRCGAPRQDVKELLKFL